MPRSVNSVASRARRKKILSRTKGNFGRGLMYGQLLKTPGKKASSMRSTIAGTKKVSFVHYGYNASMLQSGLLG